MYEEILQKLGLSTNEARMYELLLTKGKVKARDLVEDSGLGRGNVYNILTGLVARGLATVTEGKQQTYQAAEPTKLASLVEEQKRKAERLSAEFADELPKLLSTFNLTTGKPAVQVFEGLEGVEQALMDSLTSKGEILTYMDPGAFSKEIRELNAHYVTRRRQKGIAKRIILPDTEQARTYIATASTELTSYLCIPSFSAMQHIAVEIYDNAVSYLNIRDGKTISVVIHDVNIADFHRNQFQFLWQQFTQRLG